MDTEKNSKEIKDISPKELLKKKRRDCIKSQ